MPETIIISDMITYFEFRKHPANVRVFVLNNLQREEQKKKEGKGGSKRGEEAKRRERPGWRSPNPHVGPDAGFVTRDIFFHLWTHFH